MKKQAKAHVSVVRTVKLPIDKVSGDWKATTQRWRETERQVQQCANMIWREWERWHLANDSIAQQKAWLEKRAADGKDAAGKPPVVAVSPELQKQIYYTLQREFPQLHGRVWGLLLNKIVATIKTRKAARGSLPGWLAILFCHEGRPSYTHPLPIPFDAKNAKLSIDDDGTPVVELRSWKPGDAEPSIVDTIRLWHKGLRIRSQYEGFRKIVAGEWKFCGSSIAWSRTDNRWYVHLAFQRPKHKAKGLSKKRTATLFPGRRIPFVMFDHQTKKAREPGRWLWLQQRGHHIASVRRRVFGMRRDWNANYKLASQRKGHGHPGESPWSRKWREFVKRINHQVSSDAVAQCVRQGIGRLVYLQPQGGCVETRFVSTAGRTGRDQSTWEFFQLKSMLEWKCQDVGIEFVCVKSGAEAGEEKVCA